MSEGPYPHRDVFGAAVQAQVAIGPDIISPMYTGKDRRDPRIAALLSAGATVSPPQRSYKTRGKKVDWTPAEYDRLQSLTGMQAKRELDDLVSSPLWGWMEEDDRKKGRYLNRGAIAEGC